MRSGPESSASINQPWGVAYDSSSPAGRLFVADNGNNRVLVFDFNITPLAIGGSATAVLDQAGFTSSTLGPFPYPWGVSYDPSTQRLFVVYDQMRVNIFDFTVTPVSNGISPTYSLGTDCLPVHFTVQTQNQLCGALGMSMDSSGQRLFVSNLNRISEFDLWDGIGNQMNATHALGQPDLVSSDSFTTTQNGLSGNWDVTYDASNQRLFVADSGNNRIMVFYESDLAGTPPACTGILQPRICGTVSTAEKPGPVQTLANVPVQLLDSNGSLLSVQKTAPDGTFNFQSGTTGPITPGDTYYVTPVVSRTETAMPIGVAIPNITVVGSTVSLQVLGWPGTLQASGPVGSSILISTFPYTAADPPTLAANSPSTNDYYTAVIGANGTATLAVPALQGGMPYYLTCWEAQPNGASLSFVRQPSAPGSLPLSLITPNGTVPAPCP